MGMKQLSSEDVYKMALECALFISKMRDDSIL